MAFPAPPWLPPDLPSTPPTSFSDMMLWRSCLWSLLKFLIRSRATIQALRRLTDVRVERDVQGKLVVGERSHSLLNSFPLEELLLFLPSDPPAAQLSNCEALWREHVATQGKLWVVSKISATIASITQVPSQPETKSRFLKPQARHTTPGSWATHPQPSHAPVSETESAPALLLS